MGNPVPRITVLMPVFNGMPYLEYSVRSLQRQSLEHFKVLVFNDGSTDGTGSYLDALDDPRFIIVHQENAGLAATLNRMLQVVDTEFVARMDADDICRPKRLRQQLDFMDQLPDIAAAGTRQGYVAGRWWRASLAFGWSPLTPSYSPPMKNPPYWDPYEDGSILVHSAVIMRTEALRAVGGYPEIVPGQDLALWFRLHEAGYKLASMDEMLVLVRIAASGISSSNISLQYRTWEYLRSSHELWIKGQRPPTLAEYLKLHPHESEPLASQVSRAEIRHACGLLLHGNLVKAVPRLIHVLRRNPAMLMHKLRMRIGKH